MIEVISSTKTLIYRFRHVAFDIPVSPPGPPTVDFDIAVGYLDSGGLYVQTGSIPASVPAVDVGTIMAATPPVLTARLVDMNSVWYQYFIDHGVIDGTVTSY